MNWKNYVEKKNAKTFVLPAGWDSREVVAEQLECSPEKVDDHLRPALKSREVTKQQFKIWDAGLKRLVYVTAYQEASKSQGETEFDLEKVKALKASGKSYAEIGADVGLSGDAVRAKLRRAS